ncbi:MAG: hypothetical protein KC561_04580, partial [Myxococcales bacterium]|nr:hypothetical protein [Myxococcales bacterium]
MRRSFVVLMMACAAWVSSAQAQSYVGITEDGVLLSLDSESGPGVSPIDPATGDVFESATGLAVDPTTGYTYATVAIE